MGNRSKGTYSKKNIVYYNYKFKEYYKREYKMINIRLKLRPLNLL